MTHIEVKLNICKQIEEAIKKRCTNFTNDSKKIINSILNKYQDAIVIDRLLFKSNNNYLELITDSYVI